MAGQEFSNVEIVAMENSLWRQNSAHGSSDGLI